MRVSAFRQQSRVSCFDGHFYFIMSKQDEVNRMRNTVSRRNRNGFKSTLMHVFLKAGQIFIALVRVHVFYLCNVLQIYMTVTERDFDVGCLCCQAINRWGWGKMSKSLNMGLAAGIFSFHLLVYSLFTEQQNQLWDQNVFSVYPLFQKKIKK